MENKFSYSRNAFIDFCHGFESHLSHQTNISQDIHLGRYFYIFYELFSIIPALSPLFVIKIFLEHKFYYWLKKAF